MRTRRNKIRTKPADEQQYEDVNGENIAGWRPFLDLGGREEEEEEQMF